MGGIAFASLYSTLAIPFARYADRGRRVTVISTSVAVWSAFTALCGCRRQFLAIVRRAHGRRHRRGWRRCAKLCADRRLFRAAPPRSRACHFLARHPDRLGHRPLLRRLDRDRARLALGIRADRSGRHPGCARAVAVSSPNRRSARLDDGQPAISRRPSARSWRVLAGASRASGCCRSAPPRPRSAATASASGFPPTSPPASSFRSTRSAIYFGTIVLVGGIARHLAWRLARRPPRRRPPGRLRGWSRGSPFCSPRRSISSRSTTIVSRSDWYFTLIPYMLSLAWLGPVVNAVQHLVPPAMRATASASMLLINNLIGIGFGTFIFGDPSDELTPVYGVDALQMSIIYGLGFYFLAGGTDAFRRDAAQARLVPRLKQNRAEIRRSCWRDVPRLRPDETRNGPSRSTVDAPEKGVST